MSLGRRQDRRDLHVGHRAPQAVGAQHVEVARGDLVDVHVRFELLFAPQAAHHDVAVSEAGQLLVRHLRTRGAHLLGDRMVARQSRQRAAAQPVRAAVARVRDRDLLLAHRHRDDRRAHPRARAIGVGGLADLVVRHLDPDAQQVGRQRQRPIDAVGPHLARIVVKRREEPLDRVDRHRGGDLARVVPAHAVGDDEQPVLGEAAERVLVLGPLLPRVRETGRDQRQAWVRVSGERWSRHRRVKVRK